MPRSNIIRKPAVRKKTGLSDTTIWRLERAGKFPAWIQITESGLVGWYEEEVVEWQDDRERGVGKCPPQAPPSAGSPDQAEPGRCGTMVRLDNGRDDRRADRRHPRAGPRDGGRHRRQS
jgi:prophage regulatory protein